MDVDDKVVMATLTQMIIEQFSLKIAAQAREFADTMGPQISSREALLAFAQAIENTNGKLYQRLPKQ